MSIRSALLCKLRNLILLLLVVVLVYGAGRLVHVALGSFYTGERGPYLQMPTSTEISIRWQTTEQTLGEVRYGPSPQALTATIKSQASNEEHELRLSKLKPATRYYYAVYADGKPLYAGKDYWFMTAPPAGSQSPLRIWVTGDQGYPGEGQQAVRDAMLAWLKQHQRPQQPPLNLWITTGDNAYRSGTNEQFQAGFFTPYQHILKTTPVWPVYGNHDARRWPFFELFTFPENAESGGLASGTERYYSFDYANVHVVILDTQSSDMSADSDMLKWLKKDLNASKQQWLIAAFHHPPYSKGSHDSDSHHDSGGRLVEVRENVLPLLEQGGVDLVLSGHSHMYERSHLLGCHYGRSDSLQAHMIRSGKNPGQVYQKPGTIYTVIGSSSKLDDGPLDHPAMAVARHEMGSLIVDINANKLEGYFIRRDGKVTDKFSLRKTASVSRKVVQCKP